MYIVELAKNPPPTEYTTEVLRTLLYNFCSRLGLDRVSADTINTLVKTRVIAPPPPPQIGNVVCYLAPGVALVSIHPVNRSKRERRTTRLYVDPGYRIKRQHRTTS